MMRQKEYIYLIDDLETTPRKQPDLESGGKVDMEGKRGGGGGWGGQVAVPGRMWRVHRC